VGDECKVIHFPVADRMPTRVAEQRLGSIVAYKYPDFLKLGVNPMDWLDKWMKGKSVLFGWEPVNEGIVKSFKDGRVRHLVSRVSPVDPSKNQRPKIEICCSLNSYPVFNWVSQVGVSSVPVVLLGLDQTSYFRVCKRCLSREANKW